MPRQPSYRLHKPTGQAVVTIAGKDRYLGKHGSDQSRIAYRRIIAEWGAGRQASNSIKSDDVTIAMLVTDYLRHCKSYYPDAYNSETAAARRALSFLVDHLSLRVAEFGPLKLKAIRAIIVEGKDQRTGKPYARKYVNRLVAHICRMFKWGSENEVVPIDVYHALVNVPGLKAGRVSSPETDPVDPVADSLIEATIVHCPGVIADMIRVQRLTGMRPGEVCSLTPQMIDRTCNVWMADLQKHKNAWRQKQRVIFFGPRAQAILDKYVGRTADKVLFSPQEAMQQRLADKASKRVTPVTSGNRPGTNRKTIPMRAPRESYDTNSYRRAIKYACKKGNLEPGRRIRFGTLLPLRSGKSMASSRPK